MFSLIREPVKLAQNFLQLASSLSYFQTFGLQSVQFFSSFDVVDVTEDVADNCLSNAQTNDVERIRNLIILNWNNIPSI